MLHNAASPAGIGHLFLTTLERHPDREGLAFRGRRWSYRALGGLARAAAEILRSSLRGSGSRVAIIGANHPAYVVAYFGAQALGASTVEIGRDETTAAIARALEMARPDVILTDRGDLAPIAGATPLFTFDDFFDACNQLSAHDLGEMPANLSSIDGEASVVFTSGTTGVPKGVILSHGNILFVVEAVTEYLQLHAEDRYAVVLPLSHTYGKSTLLTAVAAGAASVLVHDFHDLAGFFGQLSNERCTVLSVVPFHLNVIARRGLPNDCDMSALRAITSSGGPLPWDTVEALGRLLPKARLFPMYGLTESSTRVTYLPPDLVPSKRGSVGQPLPGVQLQIRDDKEDPTPCDVIGQLYVRGPNVMQGYLGDAQLTADTLVDGWLKTGDLGRLDEDGCLFITGRQKDIIKVAGERISPVEIETVVASHGDVADAAVVGVPDPLLGETVVAYVVPRPGGTPLADLGAYCAARLSHHKVPRRFVEIDCIPRTATGKIRRYLLEMTERHGRSASA
jgi:acyl-CoA synthetase (AMP-forming)/AMP-acid ligase II